MWNFYVWVISYSQKQRRMLPILPVSLRKGKKLPPDRQHQYHTTKPSPRQWFFILGWIFFRFVALYPDGRQGIKYKADFSVRLPCRVKPLRVLTPRQHLSYGAESYLLHVFSYIRTCFLFSGWRLCRFVSAYPDRETSSDLYLLPVFSYIWTWGNYPAKWEQIYIWLHVLCFFRTWSTFPASRM